MGFAAAMNSGLSGDESAALAALVDDRHQQENLRASAADSLVRRDGPDGLAEIDLPLDKRTAIAFRAADERWARRLLELSLAGRLDPAQALRWFDSRPELSRQLDPGSLARLREVVSPPPQPE